MKTASGFAMSFLLSPLRADLRNYTTGLGALSPVVPTDLRALGEQSGPGVPGGLARPGRGRDGSPLPRPHRVSPRPGISEVGEVGVQVVSHPLASSMLAD